MFHKARGNWFGFSRDNFIIGCDIINWQISYFSVMPNFDNYDDALKCKLFNTDVDQCMIDLIVE